MTTSVLKRPQIGIALPRADAWTKVMGREKYTADYYGQDFLWAGVKRATVAHALIKTLDTTAARTLPGVLAVLTGADVPRPNRQGVVHQDQPVLVDDKVRRRGDALALVLAESRDILDEALAAIHVEFDELPGVFSPEEALAPGAPTLHADFPDNLLAEVAVEKGRGAVAMDDCPVVVQAGFQLPRQEHAYLETETGWVYHDEDGRLVIVASTQSPHRDRLEVARALGLDPSRMRVVAPFLGGGFGGKDGANVQTLLALAASHSQGRPVKMWWDREESFLAGVKRLPARLEYRLGADRDGTLKALDCQVLMDAGAYDHLGGEILALAVEHAGGPYRIPNVRIHGRAAYTNNPPGGPFRGFGVPQVTAGMEQMMDLLADRLEMDPLALRVQNALQRGDVNCVGVTVTNSIGLAECLEKTANHVWWRDRSDWIAAAGPFKRRGVGLAALWHGSGYGPVIADHATAKIELKSDGAFLVDASVADMGQGNAATFLQIAGDILNQESTGLALVLPDTDKTLPACSSAASRTTYTYARALIGAAEILKQALLEKAALSLMAPSAQEFALLPGRVRHLPSGREKTLAELAAVMAPTERVAVFYWRAPVALDKIKAEIKNVYGLPHIVFSYGVHLAMVEVDELTGRVEVCRYLAVTDAGRVINPQLYEQQIQGGVVQGLGYALMEDYRVKDGRGLTPNLTTYILPTTLDAPEMESLAVETYEASGPFGLKGVGEIPISGPLPAVSNAVARVCGSHIVSSPLTPERVLAALKSCGD